jgi:microcystin-dependent protein
MPTFLERIKARRFSAASSSAVSIGVNGESESRLDVDAGGKLLWGSGSATGDTNLYRSAADTLKTDDAFTAASLAVTGQFTLPTADGSADQVLVTNGSGTVTWTDQSGGGGASAPTGAVSMWAGSSAPSGWLECDGSAVSRSTYSSLFAVIGTRYGAGDGSTTFNLPNPVDRVAMGIALSTTPSATTLSVSSSLDSLSLSSQDTSHTHTATTGNQSANHTHTGNTGNQSANHTHTGNTGNQSANHTHAANTGNAGSHSHNVSNNTVGHSHSYTKPNEGATGNANTGTQSANHRHNLGNAGSHSHNFNTGNNSASHSHAFTTGNNSASHSHSFTTGSQSANHTHSLTTGNQSASHSHDLSSASISSSVNVEPFGFIIKT